MFWENLTQSEADRYNTLLKKTGKWIAWISTKEEDRTEPEPQVPIDEEWIWMDQMSFKGWQK